MPIKRIFLFLCLISLSWGSNAQSITPFKAEYEVYRGDSFVAKSKFSLSKKNAVWVWSMKTKARGMYRLLTRKRPFAETQMEISNDGVRLSQELHGDYPDKPARESTWFDHKHKTIFYTKGNKSEKLALPAESLFNYHSVHLLYPEMMQNNQQQRQIQFYKKGVLRQSTLTLEKQVSIPIKSTSVVVDKVTQTIEGSSRQMIYYYQGQTLAPLMIEQSKSGEDTTRMLRIKNS